MRHRCGSTISDFLWCPRHAGTPRHFECTRLITSRQVIDAIGRIPAIAAKLSHPAGTASVIEPAPDLGVPECLPVPTIP